MNLTFRVCVSYGRHDGGDLEFDYEITEEEYERLKKSAKNHSEMSEDPEIADIYNDVRDEFLMIESDSFEMTDEVSIAEKMADYLGIPFEEALERDFSEDEIEEMFEESIEKGNMYVFYPDELTEED